MLVKSLARTVVLIATLIAVATASGTSATELVKVRMSTLGSCGEVWNWWAQAKGIYQKYGLDVEQVRTTGGAASLAAVVSNSVDVGYVNGFTTIVGYNQGLPLEVISGAQTTAMPPLPSAQGLWVKGESAIKTPADLKGKKLGVNEIAGINQIVTAAWLKRRGVDPATVKFVALPFADLIPAVISGTLDAAQVPTQRTLSAGTQVRTIADPFVDLGRKVLISMYVANRDYVAKNPKVAANFHLAIKEADQQVNNSANHDAVYEIMAAGCKGDASVLRRLPDNANESNIDMGAFVRMGQFLIDQGIVTKVPDLNALVAPFARR
jgi:NitT/TauT family transport system substrate-binding protein